MSDDVDELIMTNVNVAKRIARLSVDIKRGGKHNILSTHACNTVYWLSQIYCSPLSFWIVASDQYIGDLFNQTNSAILDEIKKDERLLAATCGAYKNTDADESVDIEDLDSKPKSSSRKQVPSSSSLCDAPPSPKSKRAQDYSSCSEHFHGGEHPHDQGEELPVARRYSLEEWCNDDHSPT